MATVRAAPRALRLVAVLFALAAFGLSPPARAQSVRVTLVRRSNATPAAVETLVRLQGELSSIGVEVAFVAAAATERAPVPADPVTGRPTPASPGATQAVVDVTGDARALAVDVWTLGPGAPRFGFSRVALEPEAANAPERLAIRAVEVLRSTLLEIDLAARKHGEPSLVRDRAREAAPLAMPADVARADDRGAESSERAGIELGAAALSGVDGVGVAFIPLMRLGVVARPWLVVQATAAGFGTRPSVATDAGSARVRQQFGVLGAGYRFRAEHTVRPIVMAAVGALHTALDGQATSPRQAHATEQWSLLFDGGVGLEVRLDRHYSLSLSAHAQIAEPYVAVHFADSVVATSGRPNVMLAATLGAWL